MTTTEDVRETLQQFEDGAKAPPAETEDIASAVPPPPSPIDRFYYVADSAPLLTSGQCIACKRSLSLGQLPFDDDSLQRCAFCGAFTPRLTAIRGALSSMNMTMWSLLSSDKYIYDSFTIKPGEFVTYKHTGGVPPNFEKWLRYDAWLSDAVGGRYQANPYFFDGPPATYYFFLRDQWPSVDPPNPVPEITFSWFRYGLSSVGSVPAWRQALFGAVTLVPSNPAAAVVLIAAGFEAFFIETMRIGWQEKGLDDNAFRRLDRNALTSLVEWLPAAVQLPSLVDAPGNLHSQWKEKVNQRRNDVVHRADVQTTSEEAQESLKVALDAITFLDPFALTRPHAYFVGR